VQEAFHTEIHNYLVNGNRRVANSSDPQIPMALAPVVAGVVSLNSFPKLSHARRIGTYQRDEKREKFVRCSQPLPDVERAVVLPVTA